MRLPDFERQDMSPERRKLLVANARLVRRLDKFVGELVDERERDHPIHTLWMPSKFLPDMSTEEGRMVHLPELQEQMDGYSDGEIAVQTLNALTEEGLPLFMSALTGELAMQTPNWYRWKVRWTAEEGRHGDLIKAQLGLSGRVDMVAFDRMKTAYTNNDFDTGSDGDAVGFLVYTRFQEHGTQIAHRRTARLARRNGAEQFATGLGNVAGEEGGHKTFYGATLVEAARRKPDTVIVSMNEMIGRGIVMPGARMTEAELAHRGQRESALFTGLKWAAEKAGVYTFNDYMDVVLGMKDELEVETRTDLSTPEGRKAQDELGMYDQAYKEDRGGRIAGIAERRKMPEFPWVRRRESNQRYVIFDTKAPPGRSTTP
jgi:acyl-[acyl-carrier-protein] desaturase